ncbi:MAG: hypothetical protein ACD_40C00178G0003 [uncultured bacterium]|nr:MAG: hypothetical protein ACD_40C00178G0003 [uncultured bacterium]KKU13264.1 MAG: hypothetical protein UX21_C0050G0003 [Microgenomates group bacterium GW2011_GWC2_45_8]
MDPISILQSITLLGIIKVMLIMLLGVYAVFAGLMMRQIVAMTKAVTMKDDFIVRALGILNFGFALLILFLAIIIL